MTARPTGTPYRRTFAMLAVAALVAASGCTPHRGAAAPARSPAAAAGSQDPTVDPAQTADPVQTGDPVPSAGGGPGSGDACSLVPLADISTAVGQPMTQTSAGPAPFCSFGSADQTEQMVITVYRAQSDQPASVLSLESAGEHIDGLADDAFWVPTIGLMYVRSGDRSFTISATLNLDFKAWKAAMVQLATTALTNL